MKKIILFFLFSFLCFSQEKTIEAFFQEYNYDCENYSGEDLYEFFGFDYEDDVTPALEAVNFFCKNGYQPNKNESFIIATNVNVRNKPSTKGSNILFQINKQSLDLCNLLEAVKSKNGFGLSQPKFQ